jgi:hypothetical protein
VAHDHARWTTLLVNVEIGTADTAGGHLDEDPAGFDRRLRNVQNLYVMCALKYGCLH